MVKVLFDHNMPPAIAKAVHQLISVRGHEAHNLIDKFPKDIDDVDYFAELAKERDWIIISKDLANARRAPEKQAILRANLVAFYFTKTVQKQTYTEQAATIMWQWDRIVEQRKNNARGLFVLPVGKGSRYEPL